MAKEYKISLLSLNSEGGLTPDEFTAVKNVLNSRGATCQDEDGFRCLFLNENSRVIINGSLNGEFKELKELELEFTLREDFCIPEATFLKELACAGNSILSAKSNFALLRCPPADSQFETNYGKVPVLINEAALVEWMETDVGSRDVIW